MEDIKKLMEEMNNKISTITKDMEIMKSDLTQTFIHNFDKLNKEEVKEEVKEENKEEIKLEDF